MNPLDGKKVSALFANQETILHWLYSYCNTS